MHYQAQSLSSSLSPGDGASEEHSCRNTESGNCSLVNDLAAVATRRQALCLITQGLQ